MTGAISVEILAKGKTWNLDRARTVQALPVFSDGRIRDPLEERKSEEKIKESNSRLGSNGRYTDSEKLYDL